jgi:chromosome segregation ATPase
MFLSDDECVKELKEKEALIVKYETEIHQRMDEIEKKQIYVDRLNRKYDSLTSGQEEENLGPLEATIKNLTKEITNAAKDSAEAQRVWIKGQTDLVELHAAIEAKQTAISTLSAQRTALDQKMVRATAGTKQQQTETKEIQAAMRVLRTDFQRLNELIARNTALHETLTNTIVNMESDFNDRLKEQQRDCAQMDQQIAESRSAKEQLMEDILEAERQVMLWEKKITLEKEAQAMLDPEYGQAEVAGMKKEIHRMEYRLRQLKRKQEEMMQEMELAIEKREIIETKNSLTKSKTVTQATLKQRTMALQQTIKQTQTEMRGVDADISRQESDNQMLAEQLERMQTEYNRIEDIKFDVASKLDEKFLQKQMGQERLQMLQKRVKRYDAALQGTYNLSGSAEEIAESQTKAIARAERLKAVFAKLRDENPKYEQFFDHLLAFCNE